MAGRPGVEIEEVCPASLADQVGIRTGDRLVAINGHRVRDVVDLLFFSSEVRLDLSVEREGKTQHFLLHADPACGHSLGIGLRHFRIRSCQNKCVFCFIGQLPRGLRRTLYIRDEDYRMSFLYGSYITLTNLTDEDRARIVEQRLSPLYISVHATDRKIRNELLGNPDAPDVLKEIKFLADNRIRMHSQIVLCPGRNDGKILAKTILDLYRFHPYVASIAVVPVGLTDHGRRPLKAVERSDARLTLATVGRFQARFKRKHGELIIYAADEMYIKAGLPFPLLAAYGDLPQVENGVGMVPLFLHQAKRAKVPASSVDRRFVTFTGTSFHPYLSRLVSRLRKAGHDIVLVPIENTFFGTSVTVTGLLTGRDVMRALSGIVKKGDTVVIPDVVVREGDEVFLDDTSKKDLEEILGVGAVVVESTPRGLIDALVGGA